MPQLLLEEVLLLFLELLEVSLPLLLLLPPEELPLWLPATETHQVLLHLPLLLLEEPLPFLEELPLCLER